MQSELLQYLLRTYGGYADRRVTIPLPDRLIRVDDSFITDRSPDFCHMFVSVDEQDRIRLQLCSLPYADDVLACLRGMGARLEIGPKNCNAELLLTKNPSRQLRRLAMLVQRVVGRGRRYSNRNWKWAAPRAATSLDRLADVLEEYPGPIHSPSLSTAIRREHGCEVSE